MSHLKKSTLVRINGSARKCFNTLLHTATYWCMRWAESVAYCKAQPKSIAHCSSLVCIAGSAGQRQLVTLCNNLVTVALLAV